MSLLLGLGIYAGLGRAFLLARDANAAATDVGTFTGLPARFAVTGLRFYNPTGAALTLATMDLRSAAGGAGSAIVAAQALALLTAGKQVISTLAALALTDVFTADLTLRCVAAAGGAATVDVALDYIALP